MKSLRLQSIFLLKNRLSKNYLKKAQIYSGLGLFLLHLKPVTFNNVKIGLIKNLFLKFKCFPFLIEDLGNYTKKTKIFFMIHDFKSKSDFENNELIMLRVFLKINL